MFRIIDTLKISPDFPLRKSWRNACLVSYFIIIVFICQPDQHCHVPLTDITEHMKQKFDEDLIRRQIEAFMTADEI